MYIMALIQIVIIPILLLGGGIFLFPYIFLLSESEGCALKIPLLNSTSEEMKLGLELVGWACNCLHPPKQQAKMCQHKHAYTEASLFVQVTLVGLNPLLLVSPDQKVLPVECLHAKFASYVQ